jgi:archaellum biogenesis ATPase FlaH
VNVPADLDVVAYLASKGMKGKQANGPEVAYPCFFDCAELPNSTKRKLYVNVEEGVYDCKVCGAQGGTFLLQKHFGDDPKMAAASDDSFARRRILTHAAETGVAMLENNDDALLWLLNRGLDPETILARKLGFVGKGWTLTGSLPEGYTKDQLKHTGLVYVDGPRAGQDFLYDHVLIPYLHRGQVVQIRGRAWDQQAKAKYVTGPGDSPRLYNADDLDGADEVIITEGEFDAMILKQTLTNSPEDRPKKIAIVGLAGTSALPDNFESYFYDAKRIFVGFDSDEAGQRGAEKIREKLGSRARIIQLPYEDGRKCDWTEYLLPVDDVNDNMWRATHPYAGHGWRDVLRLMGAASGKRIFSVAEAGMAFREYRAVNNGFKTGYKALDDIILPGLLPGQLMVYLAKTGAGKTVFLCNLAVQMRAHKQLIVSLEMTREEVYERLRRIYLHYNKFASDAEVEFALSNIYICDENRLGEKDLDTLLEEFEVEAGVSVDVVYVDYLGYFARGARGNSQYEKVTNAVMSLKAVAKAHRAVLVAPAQVNRLAKEGKPIDLDDARDSGAVEETADFLFSLYRPDDAADTDENIVPARRVKLAVLKSRHGGKGKEVTFVMDMLTLAIADAFGREEPRIRRHNALHHGGKHWDDLRALQLRPRQYDLQGRIS